MSEEGVMCSINEVSLYIRGSADLLVAGIFFGQGCIGFGDSTPINVISCGDHVLRNIRKNLALFYATKDSGSCFLFEFVFLFAPITFLKISGEVLFHSQTVRNTFKAPLGHCDFQPKKIS